MKQLVILRDDRHARLRAASIQAAYLTKFSFDSFGFVDKLVFGRKMSLGNQSLAAAM